MPSTFTPNRAYELQATGEHVNTWGPPLNANFSVIDSNLSSTLSVSLSSSNVTLNATQAQNLAFALTGTLSANVTLFYPAVGGFFIVNNSTTGPFNVQVRTTAIGSLGTTVAQNTNAMLFSNGVNVRNASTPIGETPPGILSAFAGTTAPTGWMLCDGAAISRTGFAALFSAIGTTWGSGNGSTTFNIPDLRGRICIGRDNMGGSSAGRVTSSSGISGTVLGAAGGAQLITLTQSEIPPITPSGVVFVTYPSQVYQLAYGGNSYTAGSSASAFNSLTASSTIPPSGQVFGLSMNPFGSGNSHINMPPGAITNTIIKT